MRVMVLGSFPVPVPQSLNFVENAAQDYEYSRILTLPEGFGDAEFTLAMWLRLDESYPTGDTSSGQGQLENWYNGNPTPYSAIDWWFRGNFLLDGHNNSGGSENGTFSVQVINSGRLRWLFGDGAAAGARLGDLHAAQGGPALLDDAWHRAFFVRRFSGASDSDLELWIDGVMADSETSSARTNMASTYWDDWTGFPSGGEQDGWFFGAEKQAAIGVLSQYEDYKGLVSELAFYNRALTSGELTNEWQQRAENHGPSGLWRFREQTGTTATDTIAALTMSLVNGVQWSAESP